MTVFYEELMWQRCCVCVCAAVKRSLSPCWRWTYVKLNKTIYFSSQKFAQFIEIIKPLIEDKQSRLFSFLRWMHHARGKKMIFLLDGPLLLLYIHVLFGLVWFGLNDEIKLWAMLLLCLVTATPPQPLTSGWPGKEWCQSRTSFSWLKASSLSKQEKQDETRQLARNWPSNCLSLKLCYSGE